MSALARLVTRTLTPNSIIFCKSKTGLNGAIRFLSTEAHHSNSDIQNIASDVNVKKNEMQVAPFSYIIASHQLEAGKTVVNFEWSKPSARRPAQNPHTGRAEGGGTQLEMLDLNSQVGNCIPLAYMRIGTWVHDIECNPGQGAKLARAAGTFAKIVKEPGTHCLVRLPSGDEKRIDSRCRATVGIVSNLNHGARKLRKAGQKRWLGRRPVVRGVAMNPVDHPHGGGEGRTKGGKPSVSPWGKPTKAGYKTRAAKRKP